MKKLLILSPLLLANSFPALQNNPVLDQAEIINDTDEANLNFRLKEFWKKNDRQLVVITLKDLDGKDIETYATDYFRQLGVGSKELNDGVLFLIAPNQRVMRIEVGYGLEDSLTDAKAASIIRNVVPYFKAEQYSTGIVSGVDEILPTITPQALVLAADNKKKQAIIAAKLQKSAEKAASWAAIFVGVVFSGAGLFWLVGLPKRRKKKAEALKQAEILERKRKAAKKKADLRWAEIEKQKKIQWEKFLNSETAPQRLERLAQEKRDLEERRKQETERKERILKETRRQEEIYVRERRNTAYDSDSSSSFSGGGGMSGGGGASGNW